jgi:hypothetical protein
MQNLTDIDRQKKMKKNSQLKIKIEFNPFATMIKRSLAKSKIILANFKL